MLKIALPLLNQDLVQEALDGERRFAFINVWRPISTVECKPLACCDAISVNADELITFSIHYADRVGENYFASHREAHSCVYFPRMTPDEALIIKQWDSEGGLAKGKSDAEVRRATFALHSAFTDPSSPPSAKTARASRCAWFWSTSELGSTPLLFSPSCSLQFFCGFPVVRWRRRGRSSAAFVDLFDSSPPARSARHGPFLFPTDHPTPQQLGGKDARVKKQAALHAALWLLVQPAAFLHSRGRVAGYL